MKKKTLAVETFDILPTGEKSVGRSEHEATRWSTANGGDLLVIDGTDVVAIYARGVWRRATIQNEENP